MKYNLSFGKINETGDIEYALLPLVIDGENVWTNIPEKYIECGFYPVENTEVPEKDGYYYTSYYVIEDEKCVQKWEEHEIIPEIETATEEEIQEAIREGANSI